MDILEYMKKLNLSEKYFLELIICCVLKEIILMSVLAQEVGIFLK